MLSSITQYFSKFASCEYSKRRLLLILISVAAVMLLVSIGVTDFNTKGEPREAAVAHAMLSQGNWILPIDSAGDMSYKPPMFHWLIAIFSLIFGSLSEFSSRLPSALALVSLVAMTFCFFSPRNGESRSLKPALLTALFTLTAFECYRAGTNCRVDMVLAAFMCGGMVSLCKALVEKRRWLYVVGALCLSGAALTKGPVGILLPLAVFGIFGLIKGYKFFTVSGVALLVLVGSMILPSLYYYCAWTVGGEKFYQLAYEENIGRLLGTMTYDSHVKPWWYNIVMLVLGWLPWTLFLLVAGIWAWCKRKGCKGADSAREKKSFWTKVRNMPPHRLFSLVAVVVIILFYMIPKSKRSVYLLPVYPFVAYWITLYVYWLVGRFGLKKKVVTGTMVAVCLLYPIAYGVAYPLIVNGKSDRHTAADIQRIMPADSHIFTFIPDRFLRYYITDHYLGYKMKPLLPSGQISGDESVPDANDIVMPTYDAFFVALSTNVWNGKREKLGLESYDKKSDYGFHDWVRVHRLKVDSLYTSKNKTHDVSGKLVLLKIRK